MNEKEKDIFENRAPMRAVLAMVVPTVISQIVSVIYNMADIFFIGQTGDPNQVAAVNICAPVFFLLTGFANLFGIGGSGLISRSHGAGNEERARRASAFCVWAAVAAAVCYGSALYLFRGSLLPIFGANSGTFDFCCDYLFWTSFVGSIPTVLGTLFAHLIRSEGYSKQASRGMIMGALLNMVLDPIMISGFHMGVAGAALATMLSNLASAVFFLVLILKKRGKTSIILDPRRFSLADRIPSEVILTGLPSAVMCLMGTFSNVTINRLLSAYCNEAIAGVGIAKKIDLIAYGIANGMSQGVVPLIGYNYAARNFPRMKKLMRSTFAISLCVSTVFTILLFTCARPIVGAFIDDALTVSYGQTFQRIICICGPCISVTMITITTFQAMGKRVQPLVLSLFRKGGLDVPLMYLLDPIFGATGVVMATPISDFLAMTIAVILLRSVLRKLNAEAAAEI